MQKFKQDFALCGNTGFNNKVVTTDQCISSSVLNGVEFHRCTTLVSFPLTPARVTGLRYGQNYLEIYSKRSKNAPFSPRNSTHTSIEDFHMLFLAPAV